MSHSLGHDRDSRVEVNGNVIKIGGFLGYFLQDLFFSFLEWDERYASVRSGVPGRVGVVGRVGHNSLNHKANQLVSLFLLTSTFVV